MLKVIVKEISINVRDNQSSLVLPATTKPFISIEIAKKLKDQDFPPPQVIPGISDHVIAPTRYCTFCKRLGYFESLCLVKNPNNPNAKKRAQYSKSNNNTNKDSKTNNTPDKKPKKEGSDGGEISFIAFSLDPSYISLSVGFSNPSARALL
jgi:hypothetical protein